MLFRFVWVCLLVMDCILGAYLSKQYNDTHKSVYGILLFLNVSLFGGTLWTLISRKSNSLLFDGSLYDCTLVVTWTMALAMFGCVIEYSVLNWIGLFIVIIGLVLMKL